MKPENDQSYHYFMHNHFFDHVNIDPSRINLPNGMEPDEKKECARYDAVLRSVGDVDIQLLGIGRNGHIGFNEPDNCFAKGTHCVELTESTIEANKRFFASEDEVPRRAYSMGIHTIMTAKKVLVVDDEKLIVKGRRFSLLQDGMEVDCAYDGEEALNMAKANSYDMILLDVMLPKMDGFEVCQAIREFSDVPIVMLTAKGDDMDKILGLEYGADDYITKPFNILEVKARIKAIMRRTSPERAPQVQSSVIEKGDIKLDCDSRRLFINDNEINLTAREFELLEILIKNENKVYSRESLLKIVWGEDYPGDVRTVDVHVRRLREKIEANPSEPKYVHTKWGVGYYYNQK